MTAVAPQLSEDMDLQETQSSDVTQLSEDAASGDKTLGPAAVLQINEGFEGDIQEEAPPLTYIDFLPQSFGCRLEGGEPSYAEYQSVVEQANQWLSTMPQFSAVKCETIDHKLSSADYSMDSDVSLQHFSSHGKNSYARGLRVWLMPKTDSSVPTQQLGYITVLPDHASGNMASAVSNVKASAIRINPEMLFQDFDDLSTTVEKLNNHLQQKPLPGRILTVETVRFKAFEADRTDKLDTEGTYWTETGKGSRIFLFAFRIFYVVGQPAFEKIGFHDEVPECVQNPEGLGLRIKFGPFSNTVSDAAKWLTQQQNMRAVNFQSLTLKLEKQGGGIFRVNPSAVGYTEAQVLQESRYVKMLRIFYVQDMKSDMPALYSSVKLTSRMFVPGKGIGRSFETFSKTMQRIIKWLTATGTPVLGMETVDYPVNPDSDSGVNNERVDCVLNSHSGHYNLTCVRLYFPCEFKEPPPELIPETDEDAWGAWACVVS